MSNVYFKHILNLPERELVKNQQARRLANTLGTLREMNRFGVFDTFVNPIASHDDLVKEILA